MENSSGESASVDSSEGSEENNNVIFALLRCVYSNSLEYLVESKSSGSDPKSEVVTLNAQSSDFSDWLSSEVQETLSIMFLQETSNVLLNSV